MSKKACIVLLVAILVVIVICFGVNRNNKSEVNEENNTIENNDIDNNIQDDGLSDDDYLTEEEAVQVLQETDYELLGLPVSASEYEIQVLGMVEINGIECYEMSTFSDLGERKYNMGTFAVSQIDGTVYKIVDGEYVAVK